MLGSRIFQWRIRREAILIIRLLHHVSHTLANQIRGFVILGTGQKVQRAGAEHLKCGG